DDACHQGGDQNCRDDEHGRSSGPSPRGSISECCGPARTATNSAQPLPTEPPCVVILSGINVLVSSTYRGEAIRNLRLSRQKCQLVPAYRTAGGASSAIPSAHAISTTSSGKPFRAK